MVNSNAELIQSEGETRVIEAFLAASTSPPPPPIVSSIIWVIWS